MESEKPKFDFWVGIVSEGQAPQQAQAQMQAQATRQQIEDISMRLVEEVEKLREGLKRLEWIRDPTFGASFCPACSAHSSGHYTNCWLAKLLEDA